jgi:16S rRNA (cytosine967-C5)-methyltransferase
MITPNPWSSATPTAGCSPRRTADLLQAILFGVLRHRRLLDHWIGKLRDGKVDPETRDVLRVGLCQLLILGLPDHAAVNETVEAGKASVRGLVNAVLRRAISPASACWMMLPIFPRGRVFPSGLVVQPLEGRLRQKERHRPDGMEQPAVGDTFFRVNPLAPPPPNSPANRWRERAGILSDRGPAARRAARSGAIYIQDPATRHAVELLDPQPGERILDACAAPGGKAFLIAAASAPPKIWSARIPTKNACRACRKTSSASTPGKATIAVHDWTKPAPAEWHGCLRCHPARRPLLEHRRDPPPRGCPLAPAGAGHRKDRRHPAQDPRKRPALPQARRPHRLFHLLDRARGKPRPGRGLSNSPS